MSKDRGSKEEKVSKGFRRHNRSNNRGASNGLGTGPLGQDVAGSKRPYNRVLTPDDQDTGVIVKTLPTGQQSFLKRGLKARVKNRRNLPVDRKAWATVSPKAA